MTKAIEKPTATRRGLLKSAAFCGAAGLAGVGLVEGAAALDRLGRGNDARLAAIYADWLASWKRTQADHARYDRAEAEIYPAELLAEGRARMAMLPGDQGAYFATLADFSAREAPYRERLREVVDIDALGEAASRERTGMEKAALAIPADTLAGVLVKARIMAQVSLDCVPGELPTDGAYEPDGIEDRDILASIFADLARLGGEG